MRKNNIIENSFGCSVFLVIVFIALGFQRGRDVILDIIKNLIKVLKVAIKPLWDLFIFDYITEKVIIGIVIILLQVLGIYLTNKTKKKICFIISGILGLIGLFCMVYSYNK